jgi:hypothetical protein
MLGNARQAPPPVVIVVVAIAVGALSYWLSTRGARNGDTVTVHTNDASAPSSASPNDAGP